MFQLNTSNIRWYVLFLASLVTLGSYFCFDFPSVLHNQLFRHFYGENADESKSEFEYYFSLLFSLYSLPNLVLPYFGGILSDKYGNNKILLIFSSLVLFGCFIQTFGYIIKSFTILLFGRFIFGLGAETLTVCVNTLIAKWFNSYEIALALSINLSGCKLGGVLTAWLSPYLVYYYDFYVASVFLSLLSLLCYILTLYLIYYELHWYQKYFILNPSVSETNNVSPQHTTYSSLHVDKTQPTSYHVQDIELVDQPFSEKNISTNNEMSSEYENFDYEIMKNKIKTRKGYTAIVNTEPNDRISKGNISPRDTFITTSSTGTSFISDLFALSLSSWILFIITFFMYGNFVPFSSISNAVIIEIFLNPNNSAEQNELRAAMLQSIPYSITIFSNPVFGFGVDFFGHRGSQLLISSVFLLTAHSLIYTASVGPVFPLTLIGLSYSIFGCVSWACVPLIVQETYHATAYGIMGAFQNIGQFLIPLFVAKIHHDFDMFRPCEYLFIILALCSMIFSIFLIYFDEKFDNGILRKPSIK